MPSAHIGTDNSDLTFTILGLIITEPELHRILRAHPKVISSGDWSREITTHSSAGISIDIEFSQIGNHALIVGRIIEISELVEFLYRAKIGIIPSLG